MAHSIKELKKARETQSQAIEKELSNRNKYATNDDRYWRPLIAEDGTGAAIIRFLPPSPGEELPFVKIYQYSHKFPGGWYIEKSRQTIGEADPFNEYAQAVWAEATTKEEKDKAPRRRETFVSNILVVSDPGQRENEGKVFLFAYGPQIMGMIEEKRHPKFEDETPFNPYDPWEGANFKLRIYKKDKFFSYEKSSFAAQEAIGTDEEIERIWNSQYSLQDLIKPSEFKSYEELQARLKVVTKAGSTVKKSVQFNDGEDDVQVEDDEHRTSSISASSLDNSDDEDDEDMKLIKDLAANRSKKTSK